MSNGTSPGVEVKGEGYVAAKPVKPVEVKGEGYVVAEPISPAEAEGIGITKVTTPEGVTIEAGGRVTDLAPQEKAEIAKQYPGEPVQVTVAIPPDEPLGVKTITAPIEAKRVETPLTGEISIGTVFGKVGVSVSPKTERAFLNFAEKFNSIFAFERRPEEIPALSLAAVKWEFVRYAKLFVPGVWTVDWKKMTPTQRIINTAIDIAFIALLATPSLKAALRPAVRNVTRAATQAGRASRAMNMAVRTLKKTSMTSKTYTTVASRAQRAIQASYKADTRFISALTNLSKVDMRVLGSLEAKSGITGLKQAIVNINNAQTALTKAWKPIRLLEFGTPKYAAQMVKVAAAQAKLSTLLEKFQTVIKLRYPISPAPGAFEGFTMKQKQVWKFITEDPVIGTLGGSSKPGSPILAVLEKPKVKVQKWYEIKLEPVWKKAKVATTAAAGTAPTITKATALPVIHAVTSPTKTTITERYDPRYTPSRAKPDTHVESIEVTQAIGKPMVNVFVSGKVQPTTAVDYNTRVAIANITKDAIKVGTDASTRGLTDAAIKDLVSEQVKAATEALTGVQVRTQVKAQAKAIVNMVTKLAIKLKMQIKFRPLVVILPSGASHTLTPEELAGAAAWRQGLFYVMKYPPYGEANEAYSREPFPGVKMFKGKDSAYRSIVALGGKLPPTITDKMGIMDITIKTPRKGKPVMHFARRRVPKRTKTRVRVSPSVSAIAIR